jgi:ribosome-associated protein
MTDQPTPVTIRVPVRLGQLLQIAGIADTGADARDLLAAEDVAVDGEVDTRRGRQLHGGEVISVRTASGVESVRVEAEGGAA